MHAEQAYRKLNDLFQEIDQDKLCNHLKLRVKSLHRLVNKLSIANYIVQSFQQLAAGKIITVDEGSYLNSYLDYLQSKDK